MAHNLPNTRGQGADYEPYFPSERASTSNYPMIQPLTWPFLAALVELRRLEETATHGSQLERKIWFMLLRILALLPWQWAISNINNNIIRNAAHV
jgi:hypothetical protein